MAKQVIFVDEWKNVQAGILLDDGNILCGCCGGIVESDDFRLLKVYDYWLNLADNSICDPDDFAECREMIDNMTDDEFFQWFDRVE